MPNLEPSHHASSFRDVLAYIDANLDDDLSLTRLSRVARSSKFHLHHRFTEQFGVALHRYVHLARLRRAAYQLAFRPRLRVIDITFATGYRSPEAFARAFKKAVGCTPSAFRERPDWPAWSTLERKLAELRAQVGTARESEPVRLEHRASIRVAALELRHPFRLAEALQKFIAWRMENGLPPDRSATYSVFPDATGSVDLCAATHRTVAPNALGVIEKWLPEGRCAVLSHVGAHTALYETARWLRTDWLPASGERLRAAPLIIRRITLFPDVAAHLAESEIALPLS